MHCCFESLLSGTRNPQPLLKQSNSLAKNFAPCQLAPKGTPGLRLLQQPSVPAGEPCLTRWELWEHSSARPGLRPSQERGNAGRAEHKGQLLSGGVRSLIYVTLCKLQPTAFYTIPLVSAENGVSHNCIVCLEGTRDPDQVQQDLCHSS